MKKAKLILYIFMIGFLLSLVWENIQAPLYKGYGNFLSHFIMCFWASLVDAAVILLLYFLLVHWYHDFYWIRNINWKTSIFLMLAGGAIAVGFEYWAFESKAWTYTESMPVVPILKTGLSPLLLMMLLPIITFILSYKVFKKKKTC